MTGTVGAPEPVTEAPDGAGAEEPAAEEAAAELLVAAATEKLPEVPKI